MPLTRPPRPPPFQIKEQLESIITGVVEEGHNNSILLVGDRGSGKSEASPRGPREGGGRVALEWDKTGRPRRGVGSVSLVEHNAVVG